SNADGVKLAYRYDDAGRISFVDDTSGGGAARSTAYTYNKNGSTENVTYPNAVRHAYTFDALNRLRTLNVTKGVTGLHAYEYKLKASGLRRQIVEGGRTSTFTYDGLDRLTSETLAGDMHGNSGSVAYGLDKVGNRESRTSSIPTVTSAGNSFSSRDWL